MADFLNRRGILRGLATLPVIGGGITLIGQPTASAEPVTQTLLEHYCYWCFGEAYRAEPETIARYGQPEERRAAARRAGTYVPAPDAFGPANKTPDASLRAAIVLSAVGCDWRRS